MALVAVCAHVRTHPLAHARTRTHTGVSKFLYRKCVKLTCIVSTAIIYVYYKDGALVGCVAGANIRHQWRAGSLL
jgi:hypothetical protein